MPPWKHVTPCHVVYKNHKLKCFKTKLCENIVTCENKVPLLGDVLKIRSPAMRPTEIVLNYSIMTFMIQALPFCVLQQDVSVGERNVTGNDWPNAGERT